MSLCRITGLCFLSGSLDISTVIAKVIKIRPQTEAVMNGCSFSSVWIVCYHGRCKGMRLTHLLPFLFISIMVGAQHREGELMLLKMTK